MKVVVFGATGRTGQAATAQLLSEGHYVTAFVRRPEALEIGSRNLRVIQGDALDAQTVAEAVKGQDAVIASFGISKSPLATLFGNPGTSRDICAIGTRNVILAMQQAKVRRLVVVSAHGVGDSYATTPALFRLVIKTLLKDRFRDKQNQEKLVMTSDRDWVVLRPVGINDKPGQRRYFASTEARVTGSTVSRFDVADAAVIALTNDSWVRRAVSLSGGK